MNDNDLDTMKAAVHEGWPGHHFTRDGSLFTAPPVREGGATARLIEYTIATVTPLIREQVAAEIETYADAVLDIVDTQNGMRLAVEEIVRVAREGR